MKNDTLLSEVAYRPANVSCAFLLAKVKQKMREGYVPGPEIKNIFELIYSQLVFLTDQMADIKRETHGTSHANHGLMNTHSLIIENLNDRMIIRTEILKQMLEQLIDGFKEFK